MLITFPSLYVFNALVGSRLSLLSVLKLLVASIAVILAVAASLGPIVVFFALCTTSYPFMQLFNVVICAVSGLLSLAFLLRTLHRLVLAQEQQVLFGHNPQPPQPETQQAQPDPLNPSAPPPVPLAALQALGPTDRRAKAVFRIWTIVFGLVGAQMSWVLRPFIGNPGLHFEWFRQRESNFFLAIGQAIQHLFTFD